MPQINPVPRPEISKAEQHFRRCLEKLPVGAYTCDAQGLITYFNAAAVRLWGREPKLNDSVDRFCGSFKLLASNGISLKHEDCWMGQALRQNKEFIGQEVVIERPDGSRITVLAHASPLYDEAGTLVGAVNVLVDIDERKQAADAVHQAQQAAEALNRAKDKFLNALSHELRTPLSPVVMTIAAMEADPELPAKFHDSVVLIRRNIELETKLIDDLLDVSRAITGKLRLEKRPISAHGKLRHVIQNCTSEIFSKRLRVATDFRAKNDRFLGDAARFQQVFWKLLRNATKFTPEGGEISISTWNGTDGALSVAIRDNGLGIAPDLLNRIFDPFEQGDPNLIRQFGGMGLGLAIAKAIVTAHGGTIDADSAGEGMGATFTVTVATIADSATAFPSHSNTPSSASSDAPSTNRPTVLLVEDHADTAFVLQRLLAQSGYVVKVAANAAVALQIASTDGFDVVLSDIGLPDATGYELMEKLKQRGAVKGIAMSGYGMEDDIQRSRQAGFAEHLVKPVQVSQLEAALERLTMPGSP